MKLLQKLMILILVSCIAASCTQDTNICNEYASHIVELAGNADGVEYQLSPDGRWLVLDSSFSRGENIIIADTLNEGSQIQIDTKKELPEDYYLLWGASWSPDNRSFVSLGTHKSSPHPLMHGFLVVFDIADPNKVEKHTFEWNYDSYTGVKWSPDSSRILVGTTVEKERRVFVIDRNGTLLANFKMSPEITSGTWIDELHYAVIKGNRNLWVMEPEKGTEEEVYTFTNDQQILGYQPQKNMLLLLSDTNGLEFTVFDISKKMEISTSKAEKPVFENLDISYWLVSAPNSRFSGITAHLTLWIFDWETFEAKQYGDGFGNVIWSPICQGFLVSKGDKELVPLMP